MLTAGKFDEAGDMLQTSISGSHEAFRRLRKIRNEEILQGGPIEEERLRVYLERTVSLLTDR